MPHDPLRKNNRRVGVYELLEKIGQGGMSAVFKASDTRNGDIVAVKVAARIVVDDPQLTRRFEMEFAVAQPLHHPHLVRVLDNGVHAKIPYLVMEYVAGPSLAQHLKTHERLSEKEAVPIVLQIADALSFLHGHQIIHRDIKPGNILLTPKGEAKLADLGLIKDLESMSQLTRSNTGLGTMQFASPEQFENARSADARSDVYSLAATLYLMLTGEFPFGSGGMLGVLDRKLQNCFMAPIGKVPDLRPCVDAAIRISLQCDREKRPASIEEFVALLNGTKEIGSTANLPGTMPTAAQAAGQPARKSGKERRSSVRCDVELDVSCRSVAGSASQRWNGTIKDLSVTGASLHIKRRFETNTVLEVRFSAKTGQSAKNQLLRVRWVKPTESNSWLLGCEFVQALGDEELNSIVVGRMDPTKMK